MSKRIVFGILVIGICLGFGAWYLVPRHSAHYVTNDSPVLLSHYESLWKPLVQINKEEVRVVFRQTNTVNLHHALQVIWHKLAQLEGLLHLFAFLNETSRPNLKLTFYIPSAALTSGRVKLP
mgnify:CR=1 FL=1